MMAYIWVQVVDHLKSSFDVAAQDAVSDVNSLLDGVGVAMLANICFHLELGGGVGVSLVDQVVHDNRVDIPVQKFSEMCKAVFCNAGKCGVQKLLRIVK